MTSDADEPRPVLLVFVIAFGRGEKGGRVVLVYPLARAAAGRERSLEHKGRERLLS